MPVFSHAQEDVCTPQQSHWKKFSALKCLLQDLQGTKVVTLSTGTAVSKHRRFGRNV